MDCYSIVSFYTRKLQFEKPKSKKVFGNRNHVRSVHVLNGKEQYEKAKAGINSPVLQPSLAGANSVQSAMSYSNFVEKYTSKYPNVKFLLEQNQENLRFSLKNGENAPVIDNGRKMNYFIKLETRKKKLGRLRNGKRPDLDCE